MRTHPFLLINPRSGSGSPSADELAAAARERGVEPHLLEPGEDPGELALRSGAEIVGMAPTAFAFGWPPSKRIMFGIDWIP